MIDGRRIARIDQSLSLTGQRDHVVSNDPYADVVKVVVCEVGGVPLFFRQSMAFITASTGIEKLPASLGGLTDCICVTTDEVIKWGIERKLGSLVGRDGTH